jgi:hypothetical protein
MKGGGRENVEERWRKVDEKWWRRSGAKVREGANINHSFVYACAKRCQKLPYMLAQQPNLILL